MSFRPHVSAVVFGVVLTSVQFVHAGDTSKAIEPRQGEAPASGAVTGTKINGIQQAGMDHPAVLVQADRDEADIEVTLRGLGQDTPTASNFTLGLLSSTQRPDVVALPTIELLGEPRKSNAGEFRTSFRIHGLGFFGEGSIPLRYNDRQVEILRFYKPGLLVKPSVGDSLVAHEGEPLVIVLENPSGSPYEHVRARLRFDHHDICVFTAEEVGQKAGPSPNRQNNQARPQNCDKNSDWTEFKIPAYAEISLRAVPSSSWFVDPDTGFARSAVRKGWLTLRFQDSNTQPETSAAQNLDARTMEEQNVPMEIRFEPRDRSVMKCLLTVASWLLAGALLSMLLRVSVPNLTRRSQLKDALREAGNMISSISTQVDSTLRVLLWVKRRALDNVRTEMWSFVPGYADYVKRVEQGLPNLKRHIEAVRELDAALTRQKTLLECGAAPTRVEQIEDLLSAACETLKQHQLSEADWVLINQHLEGAQKLLREPTPTEKEAFEAMLSGRWKNIRDHFKCEDDGSLRVPGSLKDMEECFPRPALLPANDKDDDASSMRWVKSMGVVRADLQLSALMMLREFQFLAPPRWSAESSSDAHNIHLPDGHDNHSPDANGHYQKMWEDAKRTLTRLLSTPSIGNLREAKRLLHQLEDGVCEESIKNALTEGEATIAIDPTVPRPDRPIRFCVRFRQSNLNTAVARQLVSCSWSFEDSDLTLREDGWSVHHYFEKDVKQSKITVSFYDSNAQPIPLKSNPEWATISVMPKSSGRAKEKWHRSYLELTQLVAALLIPLATLTSTTVSGSTSGHWWQLIGIGFGADTIKNILVNTNGSQSLSSNPAQ